MVVKCGATEPNLPQAVRLGKYFAAGKQEFPVDTGRSYHVYGMRLWGAGVWIDIESEGGYLVVVPLCLFTVVDSAVPPWWVAKVDDDGDVALLPEAFHDRYFIDALSEGDTRAKAAFAAIKRQMNC